MDLAQRSDRIKYHLDTDARVRDVEWLRREHRDWWVWHSSNVAGPSPGFHAAPKDETGPHARLHADTPDELGRAIGAADCERT